MSFEWRLPRHARVCGHWPPVGQHDRLVTTPLSTAGGARLLQVQRVCTLDTNALLIYQCFYLQIVSFWCPAMTAALFERLKILLAPHLQL